MKQLLLIVCTAIAVVSHAQTNNALSLDGSGQHVTIPDNNALDISGAITVEMWIYLNTMSANQEQELIDKASNETTNYRFFLYNFDGSNGATQLGFWDGATSSAFSTARINYGEWTHIAVTISGGGLSFYKNGVLSNTVAYTLGAINAHPLTLGKHTALTTRNFNGRMEEIRIWNVARTAIQIKGFMYIQPAVNAPNLIAYYKCNEASGTTLANVATATGAAINGTLPSGGSFVASPIQYAGNALAMNRAGNNHIIIGSPLPNNSSYTKEAWVYINNVGIPNNIFSAANSPFWVSNNLLAGHNGSTQHVADPATFPTNTWTHVAVTWDAGTTTFRLFKNGLQVATATTPFQYTAETNYIGAWFNGSSTESFLGGMIDEVRLWNVARTQTQIQNGMDTEVLPSSETDLIAYYTFDQAIASGTNTGINVVSDRKGNLNGTMLNFTMTGSTSNFVVMKTGFTILPVTWLSFTASEYQQQVMLKWSTAVEENNAAFIVQHSTDGTTYTDLATLSSNGNGTQAQQYRYTHSHPAPGVNYYRIKQQDYSGAVSFSSINTVRVGEKEIDFAVQNTVVKNCTLTIL